MNLRWGLYVTSSICMLLGGVTSGSALAQAAQPSQPSAAMRSGTSYQNDTSLPLYYLPAWKGQKPKEHEGPENPKLPNHHVDSVDPVIQHTFESTAPMPLPILNFDGMDDTLCACAPPDTNGAVGETQYVQMTNSGYQVFDKTTGATTLGPKATSTIWAGFGGVCETGGAGDPIVMYDQLAKRWVITQFASNGSGPITDECVAVSTSSDATASYNRYGFHLGSNFFDYPHLGLWPDGYYMAMNVFDSAGQTYLGPQPFAFDRAAMLAGTPAPRIRSCRPASTDRSCPRSARPIRSCNTRAPMSTSSIDSMRTSLRRRIPRLPLSQDRPPQASRRCAVRRARACHSWGVPTTWMGSATG